MAEQKKQREIAMTREEIRKSLAGAEDDLGRIRGINAELQRKVNTVNKDIVKEQYYQMQVLGFRQEADSKINSILAERHTWDVLKGILGQKKFWTVEKYLARNAVTRYQEAQKETSLLRLVIQQQRMNAEALAELTDDVLAGPDPQLCGIVYAEILQQLSPPPAKDVIRFSLLGAKTDLEDVTNYPEVQAVKEMIRRADDVYTALIDAVQAVRGGRQNPTTELNPRYFNAEQRARYGIPDAA